MQPRIASLRRFFRYDHLPPALQAVARPIAELADLMIDTLPSDSDEVEAGLRKLLEAKDSFVRARL